MPRLWASRVVGAPSTTVWDLLADVNRWPDWGPSIRAAAIDGERLEFGATGVVTTVFGLRLRFEITALVPGRSWSWRVAGVVATDHIVEPVSSDRTHVRLGVPVLAAPYLVVCQLALARIQSIVGDQHPRG